jgi:hypothetical protein
MILHHVAYNIQPNSLETVTDFFSTLGMKVGYREPGMRWCMFVHPSKELDIQIVETKMSPIPPDSKISSHIAFLSDDPVAEIDRLTTYAKSKNLEFRTGGWNDDERWFDLPQIFTNFVIEIMHTRVLGRHYEPSQNSG